MPDLKKGIVLFAINSLTRLNLIIESIAPACAMIKAQREVKGHRIELKNIALIVEAFLKDQPETLRGMLRIIFALIGVLLIGGLFTDLTEKIILIGLAATLQKNIEPIGIK